MYATNEWSPLKKVIVGTATGARIPTIDTSMRLVNYADVDDNNKIPQGNYPQSVIREANQDLKIFCDFLVEQGVEVVRPEHTWPTEYYDYCPRDVAFVHGEHAIATPMPIHARHNNYKNINRHFPGGLDVVQRYKKMDLFNYNCLGNPDVLALTDRAPSFDAANILRAGDDILYLVSNSGNRIGADWLQYYTGLRVHKLENVYSYMHIDSTIAFLREGLMLINPSRIKDVKKLPKPFRNWDYIVCPEPTPIGHHPKFRNSSNWISMNLFSINENLVAVEEHQVDIQRALAKHKIECAMLPMRHAITLGGCFHCVTLDLEREC